MFRIGSVTMLLRASLWGAFLVVASLVAASLVAASLVGAPLLPSAKAGSSAPPSIGKASPPVLVGVLTEQAVRQCSPDGKESWQDPHFQVGFVRLVTGLAPVPRSLVGKPVEVVGPEVARPAEARTGGPCPAYQMRSDWVQGKAGFRVMRRGSEASLRKARRVQQIRPFQGLQVTRVRNQLRVAFTPPGQHLYPEVTLVVHYEGCYGKPGTVSRERKLTARRGGQRITADFPHWLPSQEKDLSSAPARRRQRGHLAHSVQILAPNAPVSFDLVLSVPGTLGFKCP